jgi:rhodanese-related sulfurtransferase
MQRRSVDELLNLARANLARLSPADAADALRRGALMVDIRPASLQDADGTIPGATVIERNVLEWRLDPCGAHRIPNVDEDTTVIIVCDEGYASSLAAATLQQLGLRHATDLIGGFQAWRASGLPVLNAR